MCLVGNTLRRYVHIIRSSLTSSIMLFVYVLNSPYFQICGMITILNNQEGVCAGVSTTEFRGNR